MFYTNAYLHGNKILERYFDDEGRDRVKETVFKPTLYRHLQGGEFKDIYGRQCAATTFDNIKDARARMRDMKGVRDCLGMDNFVFQYLYQSYSGPTSFDYEKLDIGFVDIEVPTEDGFPKPAICRWEINAIGHYSTKTKKYHIFTTLEWEREKSQLYVDDNGSASNVPDLVEYTKVGSEKELLIKYLLFFKEHTPHILSGWNSEGFDIPYIMGRIERVLGEKYMSKLSPFGKIDRTVVAAEDEDDETEGEMVTYDITGISCIDMRAAYKKFTFKTRPNYRLDTIGQIEVGAKKLEMKHKNYLTFARTDPQGFVDYLIRDVDILVRLDQRLNLLNLITSVGWYARINFNDVFSPLKTWDAIIHNSLIEQGIVVPENKSAIKEPYAGAFVKSPIPGLYKWIKSFDLASLGCKGL